MTPEAFIQQSYQSPWILTYTGKKVNPLDLQLEDIDIHDIAHHLATINRWCGALRAPISVAQHSVHVSHLCDGTGYELDGLLHDASEAFLGEVTKWLKGSEAMAGYRAAESRATEVISKKFHLTTPLPAVVEKADRTMVSIEARFGLEGWKPMPGYAIANNRIIRRSLYRRPWAWQEAKQHFLSRFERLYGTRD